MFLKPNPKTQAQRALGKVYALLYRLAEKSQAKPGENSTPQEQTLQRDENPLVPSPGKPF